MKKGKVLLISILALLLLLVLIVSIRFYNLMKDYGQKIDNITINEVDLTKIPDGSYFGQYSEFPVSVKVNVAIKDHKIEKIDIIEHINGKGKKAEEIVEKIISMQSLKVDTISSATASSKVILKAVENALTEGTKAE